MNWQLEKRYNDTDGRGQFEENKACWVEVLHVGSCIRRLVLWREARGSYHGPVVWH